MKKLATALLVASLALLPSCSQNSKKDRRGTPVLAPQTQTQSATDPHQHSGSVSYDDGNSVSPDILAIYSGVVLQITDLKNHETISVEIPFGEVIEVDGTPLKISVSRYFPDFIMSENGYGTRSMQENNPAAMVTITGVEQEFSGWLFTLYPDVHPFENPDYDIALERAISK